MFVEFIVGLALAGSPAPKPVVECVEPGGWPAQVAADDLAPAERGAPSYYMDGRIVLRWKWCLAIEAAHAEVVVEQRWLARSLFIVGHEAAHAAGVVDEVEADCWSQRRFRKMAGWLGLTSGWVTKARRWVNNVSFCLVVGYDPVTPSASDPKPDPRPE